MTRRRAVARRRMISAWRSQGGNGLVFALLGLMISAIGAAGLIQNSRLQAKRDAGIGEATVLENLRNATNDAIFEAIVPLQAGAAFGKNGVTVQPVIDGGQPVWRPTVAQLVAMGYLPAGWTANVSTLNDAPYSIELRQVPAGCTGATCGIEGHVILGGPIGAGGAGGAGSDGAVIGALLTRIGADSGVSLPMDPTHIQGFGNTWTADNPVPGQPAGVVGLRVGTASAAFSQFVRIGDTRDPDLSGNLTVAGNTTFGNGSTFSDFKSAIRVDAQPIDVRDATGNACVTLRPDGVVAIACTGLLDAATGIFHDANGNSSSLSSTGLATTGSVAAAKGFSTDVISAFGEADPNAIVVKSGDLFVHDATGNALLQVGANGDVSASGAVRAHQLTLTATVAEGEKCDVGSVAMMDGGGLATCQDGGYRATTRYARLGDACGSTGEIAADADSADTLVCYGSYFASLSGLLPSRVFMWSTAVHDGDVVALTDALPNGCPATAGPRVPEALLYLLPQSDAENAGNVVLNRNAQWNGAGWNISLTDGAKAATQSVAIAEVFCMYDPRENVAAAVRATR